MRCSVGNDFTGRCLCGAITFRGTWGPDAPHACHCGQCRRWSGHIWAGIDATQLTIDGPLRWYQSSDSARRGFCPDCGSSLFWQAHGAERTSVAPGAVDAPTGLSLAGHIYVADKGDYYDLNDGLPQVARDMAQE